MDTIDITKAVTRTILFRGKTDGVWVAGDLELCRIRNAAFIHTYTRDGKYATQYKVDPATIGQFTGLTDKNGVQLFEGDIFHIGDRLLTYTVIWEDCGLKGKQNGSSCRIGLEYWKNAITIVGNVHDNHEMI